MVTLRDSPLGMSPREKTTAVVASTVLVVEAGLVRTSCAPSGRVSVRVTSVAVSRGWLLVTVSV